MFVIGRLKLVFDQHPATGGRVLANDISTEPPDMCFLVLNLELLHAYRVGQYRDVLLQG